MVTLRLKLDSEKSIDNMMLVHLTKAHIDFCFKTVAVISLVPQVTRGGNSDDDVSFAPEGYVLKWEDNFDGTEINTANWVIGR